MYRFPRHSEQAAKKMAQDGSVPPKLSSTAYTTSEDSCEYPPRIAGHSVLMPYNLYMQMPEESGVSRQQQASCQIYRAEQEDDAGGSQT